MPQKIVIIGAGHVGSHCAYSLLLQGVCDELALIDIEEGKAVSHALDLSDAVAYLPHETRVRAGGYEDCADAGIIVISAGLPRRPGQTRTDVMRDTMKTAREIAPRLREVSPRGIVVTISNPADVIAHYFYRELGLPRGRVFSTGTALDTARLRRVLARSLGVAQSSVSGYVLGEHGDSQTVPWSQVSVGGGRLLELMGKGRFAGLDLAGIAEETKRTGTDIIDGKGATEFGIGAATTMIARAVLRDENRILPVSALLEGQYGQSGVFAGVPAIIGKNGVGEILQLSLSEEEQSAFALSCETIRGNIEASSR